MVAGCRIGECHYAQGNLVAQYRMKAVETILNKAEINPSRLSLQWMSSAEGNRFVQAVTEFITCLDKLGPLGEAEGLSQEVIQRRLRAAKQALRGKKLRWVLGKAWDFTRQGNIYGEVFTNHELNRCFEEVILDECTMQEILFLLEERPLTVKDLSRLIDQAPPKVLHQLADMRRLGLVNVEQTDGNGVVWSLSQLKNLAQEEKV
jgi:hypothetical protein